jgi:NTE family protein
MREPLLVLLAVLMAASVAAQGTNPPGQPSAAQKRPRIGVAFGGGSARGLAHVGVMRWFEEHQIPIDLIAGTSMGGLVGGAFASGMSAQELTAMLTEVDWNEMFGFSPFRYKNIRRKEDARDYPSRIEYGIKRGIQLPTALNNGQQVEFFLTRIAGPYEMISSFDDLPTPFRAIAIDLVTAQEVVLSRGSLASAMRSTMSLPGIFPPVERDGQILVDGGALNNVPADVVRAMGADIVIAINVGFMGDTRTVNRSMVAMLGQTVDVMMLATTRAALKSADIVINPSLANFGSLDWRRSEELAEEGYRAAEVMKERLLPLAVDDAEWAAYLERRQARRRTAWPPPEFITIVGATPSDQNRINAELAPFVGTRALDVNALETRLETFAGLDRYETVGWQLAEVDGRYGIRVEARPKSYAPPFLMLGVSLQNTTSNSFEFQLAARYLAFDVAGSGSELRVDGAVGARPTIGLELYRPLGHSMLFVAGSAAARHEILHFVSDDVVVAQYSEDRASAGLTVGANLGRDSDVRLGFFVGDLDAAVETGDPNLPELHGMESRFRLAWRYDAQDSVVVPSGGLRAVGTIDYVANSPDAPVEIDTDRSNDGITRAEFQGSAFWPVRVRDRAFAAAGVGTTWGNPLPTEQFQLGAPFRLGAYNLGELRGDHYGIVTTGYLRDIGRLPDFLGGPVYLGGWLETGSTFDDIERAQLKTNFSLGVVADTIVGPMLLGGSFDVGGAWRYYVGIGRLF